MTDTYLHSYNALPDDENQPHVSATVLDHLRDLIDKHDVKYKFGMHLIHGHLEVEPGQVMLGKPMTKINACWTRPVKVERVDQEHVHGHVFILDSDGQFMPYEYRQGAPPPMAPGDSAFVDSVKEYLVREGLGRLIGIQLLQHTLDSNESGDMLEFVLSDNHGTVMMDSRITKSYKAYRTTGWAVDHQAGISELSGAESHAATKAGPHKVFISGKGLPQVEGPVDEGDVILALRRAEVID